MIRKAKKKPVEIEYMTFKDVEKEFHNVSDFSKPHRLFSNMRCNLTEHGYIKGWHINTLEGTMTMTDKDYLIIGVRGEIYPCKIDIFEETYEVI